MDVPLAVAVPCNAWVEIATLVAGPEVLIGIVTAAEL